MENGNSGGGFVCLDFVSLFISSLLPLSTRSPAQSVFVGFVHFLPSFCTHKNLTPMANPYKIFVNILIEFIILINKSFLCILCVINEFKLVNLLV